MRNFKLFLFLFLTISNLSILNAFTSDECLDEEIAVTELIRMCGFSSPFIGNSFFCDENGGITYFGGDECENQLTMKVYFTHLNNPSAPAIPGLSYYLPPTMTDVYVQIDTDFDGNFDPSIDATIGPIDEFYYSGISFAGSIPGTVHYIFEHVIDITPYFSQVNFCPEWHGSSRTLKGRLAELIAGSNNQFEIYDLTPIAGNYDVASCEVFKETCENCHGPSGKPLNPACTNSLPEYIIPMCVDCLTSCQDSDFRGTDENVSMETTKTNSDNAMKITPNPFKEVIVIEFNVSEEGPVLLEVFDLAGTQYAEKSLTTEIGKRKESINLEKLPPGVYFLKLTVNQTITTNKIVKL